MILTFSYMQVGLIPAFRNAIQRNDMLGYVSPPKQAELT
jgi:hypothetical protein